MNYIYRQKIWILWNYWFVWRKIHTSSTLRPVMREFSFVFEILSTNNERARCSFYVFIECSREKEHLASQINWFENHMSSWVSVHLFYLVWPIILCYFQIFYFWNINAVIIICYVLSWVTTDSKILLWKSISWTTLRSKLYPSTFSPSTSYALVNIY